MFYNRFKLFPITIIGLLSIGAVSLSGCTSTAATPPKFTAPVAPLPPSPSPPPMEVTVGQLSSEYELDEAAADAKYKGKRLLFNRLEVEEVVFQQFWGLVGDDKPFKIYFKNGDVSFIPQDQLILRNIMQNIETGFILNVEGICLGLIESKNSITIDISWIESIN